ncbi:unnamed protein product [Caenorhabditis auriculariae]|uniref:AB hydrolase-1 domain-containing protein n=1 Tax=Caenorhabditis auriculariae TaxID=2777116 RepID=A0A8S1HXS6_9PELO|nr:unnamed protein product [Caenorhabditis auriculariae]
MALLTTFYTKFTQWYYTSMVLMNLVWKRITVGEEYLREVTYPTPECLKDWDHRYAQLKRVKLHYVEKGPADGKVLLMVHGFPEFWYSWRFQLEHFSKEYRCIALDMRGYNESEKPRGVENYNLKFLVEDIREFIEFLGVQNVILAAHDWGGIVSWRVAMLHPSHIESLIICNCPHPLAYKKVFMEDKKQREKSWYMFMFQSGGVPELAMRANGYEMLESMFRGKKGGIKNRKNFTDEDLLAWKYVFSQEEALTPPINYYRQLLDAPHISKTDSIVQPPVLIIWGTEDAFIEKQTAEDSIKFCRYARLHWIEGASHWVQQDQPDVFNRLVDAFLHDDVIVRAASDDVYTEKSKI